MAINVSSSPLLVCLSLLLLPSVNGGGFMSIEEIQHNAVFLSLYTSHSFQWELFPYISISCNCSITSWTFIATEQPSISNGQSIQFQLWTPIDNNTDSSFSLVRSVEVRLGQVERLSSLNSFGMSLLKLTMNPPVEVTGNTIFGIFQPNISQSDLILQYQLGRAPGNYQRPRAPPSNIYETAETNINNDYPLIAVEHSCSDKCVSGFLGTESVERFFADNPNIDLVNYHGLQRLLPALNFTCNTAITSISIGARRLFGGGTPEIQIWRPQDENFFMAHRIPLAEMTSSEEPGVYEFIVRDPFPVQERDIVSVYETGSSSLELYNERDAGIYPLNIPIDEGINVSPPDDDWPLLSIETGDDGCTAGFMTPSDLARKSLTLALSTDLIFNSACVVPDIQLPCDGLLSKLTFVGEFLQSSSDRELYPELQIWRVQEGSNDTYVKVNTTGTTSVPQFTDHLNVYEFSFDPPVEVKVGYVLGYYHPQSSVSRLGLVSIQDKGPENYCVFGQNPDTLSTQSTAVASFIRTPLVAFEYVAGPDDEYSGLCVESANCLGYEGNYTCVCASGYTGDGLSSCEKIVYPDDECSGLCVENANCSGSEGNYTCVCASGYVYSGDGFSSCVRTLCIGVGAAIAGLTLIATAAIIIIVLTCLRKKRKIITTENVAYLSNTHSSSINAATGDLTPPIPTTTNEANSRFTSTTEACGTTTSNTNTNEEIDIVTFTNDAYEATNVPTSPNPAYQTAKYSSDSDLLTYDYAYQTAKYSSNSDLLTDDYAYDYIPHST